MRDIAMSGYYIPSQPEHVRSCAFFNESPTPTLSLTLTPNRNIDHIIHKVPSSREGQRSRRKKNQLTKYS